VQSLTKLSLPKTIVPAILGIGRHSAARCSCRVVATIRDARFVDLIPIRLRRSLADFAKLVELFDGHGVSFVSVTQQFNTTTSMGRLSRTFRSGLQAGRVAAKVDRLVHELLAKRKDLFLASTGF
jgi:site-specific DNA recombinase